jgi:SNF2 family DNA or RNA helicase
MKRDIKRAQKEGGESYFETLLMEAASRKHDYILDRVQDSLQAEQKVTVFTGRRADCDRLGAKLSKMAKSIKGCTVWVAHGGTEPSERDRIRHAYMAHPGPCLLVGTGDAWGESVDLQDTDLALITMLPWTPDKVIQWEGRFSRLGQKRPVLVSYVVARNTADEHVSDLLLEKLPHVGEIGEEAAAEEIESVLAGVDETKEGMAGLLARVAQLTTT